MHETERLLSGLGGVALVTLGLSSRRTGGWLAAALGGLLLYRGISGHSWLFEALGLSTRPESHSPRISVHGNRGIRVEKTVIVRREPEELYRTWRNFENLPHFMRHLESVWVRDDKRSHWVARGPADTRIEWDAEVINDHENEMIAWRSLPDSDVDNAGSVRFRRVPGGTEVRVTLEYDVPGGVFGAALAKLFHEEPSQQIEDDMRLFKQMMETAG